MTDREKLIAMVQTAVNGCSTYWAGLIADHLIANGVTVQRWIPVTERLPDTEDVFLVWSKDLADMMFCYTSDFKQLEVTHWMPLPEPPKEGA